MRQRQKKNVLAFLLGLGAITQIRVIGALGLSEVFCILFSPMVMMKCWRQINHSKIKWTLLGLIGWFLSACVTDFWFRQTYYESAIKGCGSVLALFCVTVCVFGLLFDDIFRVKYLAVGIALSACISVFAFRPLMIESRIDDLGADFALSYKSFLSGIFTYVLAGIVVNTYARFPTVTSLSMLALSVNHLIAGGSRAAFLFTFVSSMSAYAYAFFYKTARFLQRNFVASSLVAVILVYLSIFIYKGLAMRGVMGFEELTKFESQVSSKYGLLSGRSEFFSGFWAVKDSFWLGHGSWAYDTNGYYRRVFEFFEDYDKLEQFDQNYYRRGAMPYITAHSHIWHGWVWHGFLGGAFWLVTLYLIIQFFRKGLQLHRSLIAYNALLMTSGLWHLLFSPFHDRIHWAIRFTIIVLTFEELNRRGKTVKQAQQRRPTELCLR